MHIRKRNNYVAHANDCFNSMHVITLFRHIHSHKKINSSCECNAIDQINYKSYTLYNYLGMDNFHLV